MLANLSIKKKLRYSFFIIFILLIVLSFYSFYSLRQSANGFDRYTQMSRNVELGSKIQSHMFLLEMSVIKFLELPNKKEIDNFNSHYKKINHYISKIKDDIQEPSKVKILSNITKELTEYKKYFYIVVKLYQQSDEIVQTKLNINGKKVEQLLTSVMNSAHSDKDTIASLSAAKALRVLLLIRLYTVKYLTSNNIEHIDL